MSESTLVKMPHCWKSHVAAHMSSETALLIDSLILTGWVVSKSGDIKIDYTTTVLPAKSDSDFIFCLQSYSDL